MKSDESEMIEGLRRVFVGREMELERPRDAFAQAQAGHGSLAMVVGEPGIGKTTLTEQLATHVADSGGCTLVGHCYEEGSLSLAYLPFVEALRTYVLASDADALRDQLGTGAPYVARLVTEVRDALHIEPAPAIDPDEDRYRMMQSVGDLLARVGSERPTVIVLEDLHDADTATIDLLKYLSRRIDATSVLLIGTYRDVEVDRTHPLSAAIAELRRAPAFMRVPLRGLTVEEVARMITHMSGQEIRGSLAEAVHRQTEGNPLFVQEVLRYFVEQGLVKREGDRWVGQWRSGKGELPEAVIPEGLRDVIGKRLSRLSPGCNRILAIAAVIGRDFGLDLLLRVSGADEDDVGTALEEARNAGVIGERPANVGGATYRFTHAYFRQTLYDELGAARRLRLHQQVGAAIEQANAKRIVEHAAELAEHFSHSTSDADLTKAIAYCEQAAQQAMSVYGYGEAARLLERALDVQDVLDPANEHKRCVLLLALGRALLPAGEPRRAVDELAPEAFDIAVRLKDDQLASRASEIALDGLGRYLGSGISGSSMFSTWAERADRYAPPHSIERVQADSAIALQAVWVGEYAVASARNHSAVRLAEELGDPGGVFQAAIGLMNFFDLTGLREELLAAVEDFSMRDRAGVPLRYAGQVLYRCANTYLEEGDWARGEEIAEEIASMATRTRDQSLGWRPFYYQMLFATIEGRLEAAIRAADDLRAHGEETGAAALGRLVAAGRSYRALLHLGLPDQALDAQSQAPEGRAFLERYRLVPLAQLGHERESQELLDALLKSRVLRHEEGKVGHPDLTLLLDAALELQDTRSVELLSQRLARLRRLAFQVDTFVCPSRLLGESALFLGNPEEARMHLAEALQLCAAIAFRPEIALIKLDQAELVAAHYPKEMDGALRDLASVIPELDDMGMGPALERARSLQARLESRSAKGVAHPDGLSGRQLEVLRLVAAGKTDREIAEALVIEPRTASNHVANIFRKINVANRAEAAVYAVRNGLLDQEREN